MTKMKAAVFEDIKKITYTEDYPKPTPGPDDVILKVKYCAICGSDISNFKYKMYQTPLIMGHEFSGEIVEVGENVNEYKVGDRAIGINVLQEGGYGNIRGIGIFQDGGFAEYARIYKEDIFTIPDNVSYLEAAMIESFSVVHRAIKYSTIQNQENVAIVGGGNIGLITLLLLKAYKDPNNIIVVEPYSFLRDKALEFGADDAFPPSKTKLRRHFKKEGSPDFVFECAGNEKAFKLTFDLVKKGGTIVLEGIQKGSISFPVFLINNKEITLKGSISHDKDDILETIDLFAQKKVDPTQLITDTIELKDIQSSFESFLESKDRDFIKVVVKL
ncbi:MAG: hypothetical protein EU544_02555 [Promethearchaeota archaeon]|nr:MAG: hypothetical protein EU544_02555 [Candidatus Lokiarchaeota archaeon]